MDTNELVENLRAWYPSLSFKVENDRLYVNNQKMCVLKDKLPIPTIITEHTVNFIRVQIRELMSEIAAESVNTLTNIDTIGKLKKTLSVYPDNMAIVGNCVDKYGMWYNYPCYIAKVPGNNNMVSIQSKPINENQITESIAEFKKGAEALAYNMYKRTGVDHMEIGIIVKDIMKLIGQE